MLQCSATRCYAVMCILSPAGRKQMRPGSLRRTGMQNDPAGAMVARINTAFFTEDCSPTFRVSMVLFTICKHPTELRISLLSRLPQPKGKGATVFRGADSDADMLMKTRMNL